jgi:hypothetical protein
MMIGWSWDILVGLVNMVGSDYLAGSVSGLLTLLYIFVAGRGRKVPLQIFFAHSQQLLVQRVNTARTDDK